MYIQDIYTKFSLKYITSHETRHMNNAIDLNSSREAFGHEKKDKVCLKKNQLRKQMRESAVYDKTLKCLLSVFGRSRKSVTPSKM